MEKIYTELPKGWRILHNSTTAPKGYKWICNNKSLFGENYQLALLKDGAEETHNKI